MRTINLLELETWDPDDGSLNVIIETSKGSRNKLDYNPKLGLFELKKVLPQGMVFPFNFGFVPSTVGDDGDPLDVLVLLDQPVPAGCKVAARLVGVIEANQTQDGKTIRNDRLIAIAEECAEHEDIRSLKDLHQHLIEQIEHFFISYNEMAGKQFEVIARRGPKVAARLVQRAIKRVRKKTRHGRSKNARR